MHILYHTNNLNASELARDWSNFVCIFYTKFQIQNWKFKFKLEVAFLPPIGLKFSEDLVNNKEVSFEKKNIVC